MLGNRELGIDARSHENGEISRSMSVVLSCQQRRMLLRGATVLQHAPRRLILLHENRRYSTREYYDGVDGLELTETELWEGSFLNFRCTRSIGNTKFVRSLESLSKRWRVANVTRSASISSAS